MANREVGRVLTANRLSDGSVIYLTRQGTWSELIDRSVVALEPQAQAALARLAEIQEATNQIAGARLIDVERRGHRVQALYIRELINRSISDIPVRVRDER